jgi:hypothetical protein
MAGFMAGFGTTLSNLIEEDRKYYRDTAAKRREYIQTYGTKAVVDREEKANAALSVANTLMSRGFSKNYVTNVASTNGISGLVSLASQLDDRTDLTKDDIKEIEASAKDFLKKDPEQDLTTIVNRAFGLYKSESDPVKRKTNIFASMLGMDAAMAEDEVLNDMYVNGFTGRDIYRIMGSSGPKAGEPLDVTLPPKAPSPTTLATITTTLSDKYNDILDGLIQQATSAQDVVTRQELEALKASGLAGMATLATSDKYPQGKYLLEIAKQMEKSQAGLITDNFNLPVTFREEYKTYVSDKADDAKMTEAEDKGKGTTPPEGNGKGTNTIQPEAKITHKVKSEAEGIELLKSGKVKIGDSIDLNGVIRVVEKLPEGVESADAKVPGLAERFKGRFDIKPDLTIEERVADRKEAVQEVLDEAGGSLQGYTDTLDKTFAKGLLNTNAYGNTLLGSIAQFLNAPDDVVDYFYEQAILSEDDAEVTEGLIPAINSLLDEVGVPDWSKEDLPSVRDPRNKIAKEGLERIKKQMQEGASSTDIINSVTDVTAALYGQEEAEPDYAAAAMRAPEHLEKLGEQAKSVAKDLSSAISKAVDKAQTTAQEARAAKAALQEKGVTTEGMSERETIEAYDRQFISDWKNMPVALKTIVLGSMVGKNKGMTEEETIRDLDRQFIMDWEGMPVQNKTIIRDVLYGKRVESFTDEQNKRLNEMRDENPDWFIDTAPSGLSVPTPSEVETTFKSRPDRGPGIMSRMNPTETKQVDLEGAPKIGDVEFENMLERVHGGKSDIVMNFRKKISEGLKAADVTRLIKSTQGLPKTKSRDTLLMSLYDLRDALNKR